MSRVVTTEATADATQGFLINRKAATAAMLIANPCQTAKSQYPPATGSIVVDDKAAKYRSDAITLAARKSMALLQLSFFPATPISAANPSSARTDGGVGTGGITTTLVGVLTKGTAAFGSSTVRDAGFCGALSLPEHFATLRPPALSFAASFRAISPAPGP